MANSGVSPPVWRPMTVADLPTVVAIAKAVHLAHPERDAIPAERLALFPDGCLVAVADGIVAGYAVAHPWRSGAVPALDTLLGAIPADADVLYLHDVALLAPARGAGAARAVVALLSAVAARHGLARMVLTAVEGTAGVWERLGFVATRRGHLPPATLASYGPGATSMTAAVRPPPDRLPTSA